MDKRWAFRQPDEEKVRQLRKELPVHPALCQLLIQRGITTYDEARDFFRPVPEHLHDPFLMKGMQTAIERIEKAFKEKEKILIYGDYDVDGTTAVALVYSFFREYYPNLDYYVPNRYREGYGISRQGIDWAKENGFSLVIALDCGIKEADKIEYASQLGIDFIICDHHIPGDKLPAAAAVLDPRQPGCGYPCKELSGCGIGFKLAQAYLLKNHPGTGSFEKLKRWLDLVVVSIASDIVPITGENRVMAHYGLQVLNESPRKGLRALMDVSGLKSEDVLPETGEVISREINISDIVFIIGPRINAAGRMDDARDAVRMLVADTDTHAYAQADKLHVRNDERVQMDRKITEEALKMIENNPELQERKSTVLFSPDWHKGVIGIVASRVIEKCYRPTILLAGSDGMLTGSARSIPGFDIYQAICSCSDLLERMGGHKYAAGLTLKKENLPRFIKKFEQVVSETLDESLMTPEIKIDAELNLGDITPSFYNILKQFAPFGPGNMKPVFLARQARDAGYSKIVGKNHLKISVRQNGSPIFNGIAFGQGGLLNTVASKQPFDLCYALRENNWYGRRYIELEVKDLKTTE